MLSTVFPTMSSCRFNRKENGLWTHSINFQMASSLRFQSKNLSNAKRLSRQIRMYRISLRPLVCNDHGFVQNSVSCLFRAYQVYCPNKSTATVGRSDMTTVFPRRGEFSKHCSLLGFQNMTISTHTLWYLFLLSPLCNR